jgi:hypothetical protein
VPVRRAGTVVLVLTVAGLVPASSAAEAAPTPEAPVVVAGVPVTLEQARQRAGRDAEDFEISGQLRLIVHARWVAGEAARLGLAAKPARVAGLIARTQRAYGGAARWKQYLAERGVSEAEARTQIGEQALREALGDAITASARGDARRWGRAMDDFDRRWRATTVCLPDEKGAVRDACGNLPGPRDQCAWHPVGDSYFFALGELCRFEREWSADVDLLEQFHPRASLDELAC